MLRLENQEKLAVVLHNNSCSRGVKAQATPLEQQKASICGYPSTSLPQSLNMSCSKSLAPKLYPDL